MHTTSHPAAGADILDELLIHKTPALLLIGAAGCATCDSAAAMIRRLADEYADRVNLVQVDAAEAPGLLQRVGLARLPGLVFVRGGRELARLAGGVPEPALRSWLDYTIYGGVQPPVPHGPSSHVHGLVAAAQPANRPRYDDF
jgi:thioredoxin 1